MKQIRELDCNLDVRGYFTISTRSKASGDNDDAVIVTLHDPQNDTELMSVEGMDIRQLCDACQLYISEISHALYLGGELQRAIECVKQGTKYVQL